MAHPFSLSPQQLEVLDNFLAENEQKGFIGKSQSPQVAPLFFIPKKNNKLGACMDYQKLNDATIKNAYPILGTNDLFNRLRKVKVFTKLDLHNSYYNIWMKEGDKSKVAFTTPRGLYKPLVMFFRLCNAPATFQAYVDETFGDFIAEGWFLGYLDDSLILSEMDEEDFKCTKQVLQQCREEELHLHPDKCEFSIRQMEYLGFRISANGIMMDPTKLDGIFNWPTPKTVTQVKGFLGFANFYGKFIPHYLEMVELLNRVTLKPSNRV